MSKVKGVLLDVDGTLVKSNHWHARAWVDALAEVGIRRELPAVKRLIGMGSDKLLPELVPGLAPDAPRAKRLSRRHGQIFMERYSGQLQATPGSRELVQRLRRDGYRMVVASSASSDQLECLLEAARVNDLLNEATTSDDARRSKPDPDIIQTAIQKIGLPAEKVIMIGDTPYDIEAAGRAGIAIVALRSGGWPDAALKGAAAIYDHLADLLAHLEISPLKT